MKKIVRESVSDEIKEGNIFRVWIDKEASSLDCVALMDEKDGLVEFEIIQGPLKGEKGVAERMSYYHNSKKYWHGWI